MHPAALVTASLFGLTLGLTAQQAAPGPARGLSGSRPNILFVFSDDHACHAISAYGSQLNRTPSIDRLATTGALFRRNFCGNALCGPSRATILTGLHSHANGFHRNGNVFDGAQVTLPKLLQEVGYQTAVIGKWHLASEPVGFDHWMVLPGQGEYYNPDFSTRHGRVRHTGHVTDLTTQFAIEWLDQRDPDKPFLLLCQHKAPHRNWLPAEPDLGLYREADLPEPATLFDDYAGRAAPAKAQEMEIARHLTAHYDLGLPPAAGEQLTGDDAAWSTQRARMTAAQRQAWDAAYAAEDAAFGRENPQGRERVRWMYQRYIKNYLRCVAGVDRSVGTLLDWLDAHPAVKANTLVVYASDQGFYLGDHGWYDKRWMYEESLRMPLLMAWPGRIEAGAEIAQLTQNIDFAPTFLDLAGVRVPAGMHGASLVPLLERRAVPWRDAVYYHYYESQAVHMVPAMYGVRTERYKLVHYYEPQWNCWELFDLQQDPQERRSVADHPDYADVRVALTRRLTELRREFGDDTGQLGDGAWPLTAGIARVVRQDEAWRIWANAEGGYVLATGVRGGTTSLSTGMRPVVGPRRANGFLVLTGGDARRELVRAGVDFDARRLVVIGPGGMHERAQAPIAWDGASAIPVRVTVDLAAHTLVAEVSGARVEVSLPAAWRSLTAWGFGASDAETVFGDLVVQ